MNLDVGCSSDDNKVRRRYTGGISIGSMRLIVAQKELKPNGRVELLLFQQASPGVERELVAACYLHGNFFFCFRATQYHWSPISI